MQQKTTTVTEIFNAHVFKGLQFTDDRIENPKAEDIEELVNFSTEFQEYRITGVVTKSGQIYCPTANTLIRVFLQKEDIKLDDIDLDIRDRLMRLKVTIIKGMPENPFISSKF
jgi:hypothetical protein